VRGEVINTLTPTLFLKGEGAKEFNIMRISL